MRFSIDSALANLTLAYIFVAPTTAQSDFRLVQSYSGNTFFSGWDFFTGSDPNQGLVQFVDEQTAQSSNLTSINDAGNAIIRVDTTPQVSGNPFWTNGPTWPLTGEIVIVEGVNNYRNNQARIHANVGCQLPSNTTTFKISGSGKDCATVAGCGVRAIQTNSFGGPFNSNRGGVYAMLWDTTGISVWLFPRQSIPSDITASAPVPGGWGTPMAFWPASRCDPFQFFQNHGVNLDTTLCGDWAGFEWTATDVPGQDQSCAQITGVPTCEQFVKQNGTALSEAYWEVKSVRIYQSNS